jgi:hypothetical protein
MIGSGLVCGSRFTIRVPLRSQVAEMKTQPSEARENLYDFGDLGVEETSSRQETKLLSFLSAA